MTITQRDLIERYGRVAEYGGAALLVGAGLSRASGLPNWADLIDGMRQEADVPESLQDMPLVAEYIVKSLPGGEERLEQHILQNITSSSASPSKGHRSIAALRVDDLWTTNYDRLIEQADPEIESVATEGDLSRRTMPSRRRLMKMHGSVSVESPPGWHAKPVITRKHFETYEADHPKMWAALRATYLTKTFLFLGFSFDDPNIGLLLRLSRSLGAEAAPLHYTVLRVPSESEKRRLHELRVQDLQDSGVVVCEIEDYAELDDILDRLVRRTMQPRLLVTGSDPKDEPPVGEIAKNLGNRVAEWADLTLTSFAGSAALDMSFAYGNELNALSAYRPGRIEFRFRKRENEGAPALPRRTGTEIYTGLELDELRVKTFGSVRAMVVIGGNERPAEEVEVARGLGVPIIPLAFSGGAARKCYDSFGPAESNLDLDDEGAMARDWEALAGPDAMGAVAACSRLIGRVMFLEPRAGGRR